MPNPRITIETYLGRIPPQDIKAIKNQLKYASAQFAGAADLGGSYREVTTSMVEAQRQFEAHNRSTAIASARYAIATQQIRNFSEGLKAFKLVVRDAITPVGMLNNVLSIMTSRFGMMILAFGAWRAVSAVSKSIKDATRELDTATRRVQSTVVPTFGTISDAVDSLQLKMLRYTATYGISLDQFSDTMYYLASAGRTHTQILNEVDAAQKLIIASSKDMGSTTQENKQIVESFVGLINLYGDSIKRNATEQERAAHLAGVMFSAFKVEQILVPELAVGLSYAATQAKFMNISVEELIQSVSALNTIMIKGSKAGTSYMNALRDTVVNADKLKKIFGIDIKSMGENFSFLEEVVKPVTEQLNNIGNAAVANSKLMEVYNIRATRAMIGLGANIDRNIRRVKELKEGEEDLNYAFDTVTDSIKFQEQRMKNLTNLFYVFLSEIATGGRGREQILKGINDALQNMSVSAADLAYFLSSVTNAMIKLTKVAGELPVVFYGGFKGLELEFNKLNGGINLLWKLFQLQSAQLSGDKELVHQYSKEVAELAAYYVKTSNALIELQENSSAVDNLYESFKDLGKGVEGSELLWRYFNGELSAFETVQEGVRTGIIKNKEALGEQVDLITLATKAYKASSDAISENLAMYDRLTGKEIKAIDIYQAMLGDRTAIARLGGPASTIHRQITDVVANLEILRKEIERSGEKITTTWDNVNQQIVITGKFGMTLFPYLDALDESVRQFKNSSGAASDFAKSVAFSERNYYDMIKTMEQKTLSDILLEFNKVIQETTANIDDLVEHPLELTQKEIEWLAYANKKLAELWQQKEDIRLKIMEEGFRRVQDMNDKIIEEEKLQRELTGVKIDGKAAWDWYKSNLKFQEITSITFAPKIDVTELEEFKSLETRIMNEAQQDMEAFARNTTKELMRIDEGYITGRISGADKIAREITLRYKKEMNEFSGFSKHKKDLILKNVEFEENAIRKIAKTQVEEDQKRAIEERSRIDKAIESTKKEIDKWTGKAETREQREYLDSQKRRYEELQRESIRTIVLNQQELGKQEDEIYRRIIEQIRKDVGENIDAYAQKIKDLAETWRQAVSIIRDENQLWADSVSSIADVFSSLSTIVNEHNKTLFSIVGTTASTVAQLISLWGKLQEDFETKSILISRTLMKFEAGLGAIGIIVAGIAAIASIFTGREKEKRVLEWEMPEEEKIGKISPDYGQARVINNRINLSPVFQLLDPSQLTEEVQRRIAATIFDEIVELQKTSG